MISSRLISKHNINWDVAVRMFPVAVRIELKVVKIKLCNFQTSRSFDPVSIDNFKLRLMNYAWDNIDYSLSASNDP